MCTCMTVQGALIRNGPHLPHVTLTSCVLCVCLFVVECVHAIIVVVYGTVTAMIFLCVAIF